jgi:hypothetical protein
MPSLAASVIGQIYEPVLMGVGCMPLDVRKRLRSCAQGVSTRTVGTGLFWPALRLPLTPSPRLSRPIAVFRQKKATVHIGAKEAATAIG